MKRKKTQVEYAIVEDIELSEEEVTAIDARINQAEKELSEARVHFRWGMSQVILIKKVAAKMGIPYQTYMKQAIYRQAMQDLEQFKKLEHQI